MENTAPAEITGQLKQEKTELGNFVWAHGYICEVMEINGASWIRLAIGCATFITEDGFAGFEIRLVAKRSVAEKVAQTLQTDPKIYEKTTARFRKMAREKPREMLDQAVARLWHGLQQAIASHAGKQ